MATATIVVPTSTVSALASSMEQTLAPAVCRLAQKFVVFFPDIKFQNTIFRLNRPVELILQEVDDGWICQEEVLSLSGFGETSIDAVDSVFEDFAVLWDEIAQAPDEDLSEDAQRTKLTLLGFVKSVEEIT